MKKIVQNFTAIILAIIISGCASIISKSTYPVSLQSSPSGAEVTVIDEAGQVVHKGKTPMTITLEASAGFFDGADYTVNAKLPNGQTSSINISSQIDGWYVANLLFGGIIGLLIVDPATGAMYKLTETATVTFSDSANLSEGFHILCLENLSPELQKQVIPVEG